MEVSAGDAGRQAGADALDGDAAVQIAVANSSHENSGRGRVDLPRFLFASAPSHPLAVVVSDHGV